MHIAEYKSLPLLPSDKRVAIVACWQRKQRTTKEQTKPGRRIGHWTRDEGLAMGCKMQEGAGQWTRQISRVYLRRSVWPVSFQHLHMFPVTFDDYMIFLLFTRRVAFSFYLAWFVFCFGVCFCCCCCHLRNVQRNGATADALHKNKSPTHSLTHTPSENRNNDVAHVPSCSRLEWLCPCHCPPSLFHSASAYGQCSIQSPGDLRAIQQFYDFTIFMQRSTI